MHLKVCPFVGTTHPKPLSKAKLSSAFILSLAAICTISAVVLGVWGTRRAGEEAEAAASDRAAKAEKAADDRAKIAEDKANSQIAALKEVKALQDGGDSYPCFDLSVYPHANNRLTLVLSVNGKYDMHAVAVLLRDNILLEKLNAASANDVDSLKKAEQQSQLQLPILGGFLKATTIPTFDFPIPPTVNSVSWTAYIDAKNGHWMQHIRAHRISGKWEFYITLEGTFIDGVKVVHQTPAFPEEGLKSLVYEVSQSMRPFGYEEARSMANPTAMVETRKRGL